MAGYCPESCCTPYLCSGNCCTASCCETPNTCCDSTGCASSCTGGCCTGSQGCCTSCCDSDAIGCCGSGSGPCFDSYCGSPAPTSCCGCPTETVVWFSGGNCGSYTSPCVGHGGGSLTAYDTVRSPAVCCDSPNNTCCSGAGCASDCIGGCCTSGNSCCASGHCCTTPNTCCDSTGCASDGGCSPASACYLAGAFAGCESCQCTTGIDGDCTIVFACADALAYITANDCAICPDGQVCCDTDSCGGECNDVVIDPGGTGASVTSGCGNTYTCDDVFSGCCSVDCQGTWYDVGFSDGYDQAISDFCSACPSCEGC